ncbi:copper uptake system-associated protein [Pseudorhodobacter turbinis]|uniref:copper uptake system-associated protein n=1 Tax=Pseudorhodobacter turbinis TaxID=2500533 RepID=UPI00143DD926|nr:copper uptake system-associated protein [Pseudorhodobacter turbinis]
MRAERATPDAIIAPITIAGDIAIAGWTFGFEAARVFLRNGPEGWRAGLISNDSLLLPSTLVSLGMSRRDSTPFLAEVRAQEAALGPDFSARFDAFGRTAYPQAPPEASNNSAPR